MPWLAWMSQVFKIEDLEHGFFILSVKDEWSVKEFMLTGGIEYGRISRVQKVAKVAKLAKVRIPTKLVHPFRTKVVHLFRRKLTAGRSEETLEFLF